MVRIGIGFALILALMATAVLAAPQQHYYAGQAEFTQAAARLGQKNTLEYGQRCSYQDEKAREAIGIKMLNMAFDLDFSQFPILTDEINHLIGTTGQFCNGLKNMNCNSTGFCDCANADALGMRIRSFRENGACRLHSGSACAPQESLQALGDQKPDQKCHANSECVMKSDELPCTEVNMQRELLETYGADNIRYNPKGFMQFVKQKMADGVCICSGIPPEEEMQIENHGASILVQQNVYIMTYLVVLVSIVWFR